MNHVTITLYSYFYKSYNTSSIVYAISPGLTSSEVSSMIFTL